MVDIKDVDGIFNSFLVENFNICVDADGIRITNPVSNDEITMRWDTYYDIHTKASDFYEAMEGI